MPMMLRTTWSEFRLHGNRATAILVAACVLGISGCGKSDLPPMVPVHGTVAFNGGPCPASGSLRFAPLEVAAGLPNRPGRADFDVDGRYEARSFANGDGLVPGKYRVFVECWKQPPADGKPGISYISNSYQPPELVVDQESGSVTFDLEVPKSDKN